MTNIFEDIRKGAEEQIETANFVLSRMRNAPVVALVSGEVILKTGGVWPIPAKCGDVALFKSADDARAEAAAQNERSEAQGGSLHFMAMSFHKAARLQLERAENILKMCDEAEAKA